VIDGVVTAVRMEVKPSRWGHYYEPCISYSYTIGDVSYAGERWRFGETDYNFRSSAETRLARYQVGAPVQVHYHPSNPKRSVLEVGVTLGTYLRTLFFAGAFAVGLGLLLGIFH
jgi:uncharacterized protein DUF3592